MNVIDRPAMFETAAVEPILTEPPGPTVPPMEFLVALVPGFSQLCLSSFIDPLRVANAISGRDIFRWRLVGEDGAPVECASGIDVCVTGDIREETKRVRLGRLPGAMVICADEGVERQRTVGIRSLLRLCARRAVPLFGLGTGTWILAESGLLSDASCTIHWAKLAALSETFDCLRVSDALFVRHRDTVTCAGELAAFDLAVSLIEQRGGPDLARAVCRVVMADRWRDGASCQTIPAGLRYSGTSGKLIETIRIMERAVDGAVPLSRIAREVGLSRRQVERLFRQFLATTPSRYYLDLRLARARQLIESTDMRVVDIAIACGFLSVSHFTGRFKKRFGASPSKMRRTGCPVHKAPALIAGMRQAAI